MKFDYLIGNVPFQEVRQGHSNTATPIYNSFMDEAYKIAEKVELITPARFLFDAGYTPHKWNQKMLNDEHLKILHFEKDSKAIFPNTDIKGGVVVSYHDMTQNFGAMGIFSVYPSMNGILRKVIKTNGFVGLDEIIVTSFAYHYTSTMYDENPTLVGRSSKGHEFDLQSNTFDTYPEIYVEECNDGNYIRILGRSNNQRCYRYIKRNYVKNVINLDSYKVFISKASGTGLFGEALTDGILGYPSDGATVTFSSIGNFKSEIQALNCKKYIRTKFSRALLGVLKVTQDLTPKKWKYVPLQDFTVASDIDWSTSIHNIDLQLYKKYGLSDEEINFIETHVKEME
ncbi:MAG: Eco57I restriction-modification methylase domain-containing protein [Eubacteriales bacterium]|nr:Eco57I restriction-modification methylase domain-containing protein [Eubacteriales bacterium]